MKIKLLIFILISKNIVFSKETALMKMYALYTPSHEILLNKYFQPSMKDTFDLKIQRCKQKCASAEFESHGWNETMIDKVDVIINAIKENFGKTFIFSDVDIIFIKPVKHIINKIMKKYDFVIQKSSEINTHACTGFFAIKGNENNLNLWKMIRNYMITKPNLSEENVLNIFIKEGKLKNIKWNYLPNEFFNGGMLTNQRWYPGTDINLPKNILLHHANWTVGINNKIAQLEFVLKKVKQFNENKN